MSTPRLLAEIRSILPPTAQVRTGEQQAKQDASDTTSFLSFLQKFLLAFGFVALFVGAFVIVNTLSITIAQRTRELATLRTIGATRNQVLGSVLLESLVIGVLASVVGLFLGLLLAKGMDALFSAAGIDLPKTRDGVRDADGGRLAGDRDHRHAARLALAGVSARPGCRRSRPCARARSCRRCGSPASRRSPRSS